MKRLFLAAALQAAVLLLLVTRSNATFHIMVVDQVFPGFPAAPEAQYVMLRTEFEVQTLVHGQPFPMSDASGNALGSFATFCATGSVRDFPRVSPACSGG